MHRFSIRTRLVVGTTVLLGVSFILLAVLNYRVTKEWIREDLVTQALPLTRDNIYSEIHREMSRPIHVSETMASDAFLKEWAAGGEADPDRVVRYLKQIHDRYGFFSVFFVSARTKLYYHFSGVQKTLDRDDDHDVWFYDFVASKQEYVLDVDNDEAANNELTIFINFRLEDENGELLGVTGVGMKLERVARMLEETGRRYGRRIFLVDGDGLVQVHEDPALIEQLNIRDMPGLHEVAEDVLSVGDAPEDFTYALDDERILLTVRHIEEIDWFLMVAQTESSAMVAARTNFFRTMLAGGIVWILVVLALAWGVGVYQHRLERSASVDSLTGLANRRRFEEQFDMARDRLRRKDAPFSVILMDLDGFKAVNDRLGHVAGDRMLTAVARTMRAVVRPSDLAARWGGDEFIVLVESGREEAAGVAERLRAAISAAAAEQADPGKEDPRTSVSVSCGVAEAMPDDDLDDIVKRTDAALYAGKNEGGDSVRVAE